MSEIRRIRRDNIGTILKQGDTAEVHFSLYDAENGNDTGILNQPAEVVFLQDETVVYTTNGQVDDMYMCKFHVETVLPAGLYHVEFIVNGGIYPSGDKPYFTITKSSRGADVNIIQAYGFDDIVARAISEVTAQLAHVVNDEVSKVTVDSEVILARGGKTTLGARIDEIVTGDGLDDGAITIDKLNSNTINILNSQGALRALELDFKQFNLIDFGINGVPTGNYDNSTVNPDSSIRVEAGGYFFPQANFTEGILSGDKLIAGLQILEDTAQASIQFEIREGVTQLALYDFHNANNGWLVTDVLTIPSNATNARIRVDNRGKDGYTLFTNYFIQNNSILRPLQTDLNASVSANTQAIDTLNTQLTERTGLKRYIPYQFPEGFRWKDNPLNGHIFTDGEGNFEVVGFDVSSYKPSGKYYYVDYNNGDDANNGLTLSTAFKTVGKAKSMSDSVGAYLVEGLHPRTGTLFNDPITKPFALVAVEGHEVWYTSHNNSIFAPVSAMPGVYHATRSALGTFVADKKYVTDGLPYDLKQLPRASEVAAMPGSYAFVDDKLYVHLLDGREPDADVILSANGNLTVVQGGNDLYLEGINFIGGQSPLHVQNTPEGLKPRVFAKNCNFMYSGTENNDVVMIQGADLTIFQNCKAGRGLKDGFNYHWRNGITPKSIEINCQGFENGNDTDDNDQGSTTHDGGSIIRINGAYYRNKGANTAEDATVGDNPTEALNLGCVGFESISPNPIRAVNFDCYDGVKMWVDGCIGYGSPYDFAQRGNNSELRVRNTKAVIESVPEGQRLPMRY